MPQIVRLRVSVAACTALCLGACGASVTGSPGPGAGNLPDAVVALAAPYQDLGTARLRPEDGCYWYLHAGPVETTLIPLRTAEGNPICTRPAA